MNEQLVSRASERLEAAPPALPARGRAWLRWLGAVAAFDLLLLCAHALGARLSLSPFVAYAVGFSVVCGSALLTSLACPPVTRRALPIAALLALALWPLSQYPPPELLLALCVTSVLLLAGTLLGSVVGFAIEHPGHLVFVAIVSSVADLLSVFHPSGPSAEIAQSEAALSVLALPWPMLGTTHIEPFLGVGDVVFTALYLASTRRHGLPLWRSVLALTLGFGVTMAAVLALQSAVPALPMLGLAMVVAQPRARRPPAVDRVRGYALALLICALAALLLLR